MKKSICAFMLCVMFLLGSACSAETVYGVVGEPYYHTDPNCTFGNFCANIQRYEAAAEGSLLKAQKYGMRACPCCASQWIPIFTTGFPDYEGEIKPYGFGVSEYVDSKLISKWGNFAQKMETLFPTDYYGILNITEYPEDYAGVYLNASGTYTVLIVNPTSDRIADYRKNTGCEFWVLNAEYSMNELNGLDNVAVLLWSADTDNTFNIVSVGVNVEMNRVEIRTTDVSTKNVNRLSQCIEACGFSSDMLWIGYGERGTWE